MAPRVRTAAPLRQTAPLSICATFFDSMACDVILVRHGVTEWHREKRVLGHRDLPLCEEGIEQAEVVDPAWLERQTEKPFVLAYVTNHGAREEVAEALERMGYRVGSDYLAVG